MTTLIERIKNFNVMYKLMGFTLAAAGIYIFAWPNPQLVANKQNINVNPQYMPQKKIPRMYKPRDIEEMIDEMFWNMQPDEHKPPEDYTPREERKPDSTDFA